jgi:hypothetical protein
MRTVGSAPGRRPDHPDGMTPRGTAARRSVPMSAMTPGKAFGLSLLAFVAVVVAVVVLWDTLGVWLAVIILLAAVAAVSWPVVAIARRS